MSYACASFSTSKLSSFHKYVEPSRTQNDALTVRIRQHTFCENTSGVPTNTNNIDTGKKMRKMSEGRHNYATYDHDLKT